MKLSLFGVFHRIVRQVFCSANGLRKARKIGSGVDKSRFGEMVLLANFKREVDGFDSAIGAKKNACRVNATGTRYD